jgi:hypothetical protein
MDSPKLQTQVKSQEALQLPLKLQAANTMLGGFSDCLLHSFFFFPYVSWLA